MRNTTTVKDQYSRPTARQCDYAESLARKAGYRTIAEARRARTGRNPVKDLTRGTMSELIDWLKEQ